MAKMPFSTPGPDTRTLEASAGRDTFNSKGDPGGVSRVYSGDYRGERRGERGEERYL